MLRCDEIAGVEHARPDHQPGERGEDNEADRHAEQRTDPRAERVQQESDGGDQPPLEQRDRVGQVFERLIVQGRAPVEKAAFAHLGPGRVDADGHEFEQGVDDPDAEIVAGRAGEAEGEQSGRRCGAWNQRGSACWNCRRRGHPGCR